MAILDYVGPVANADGQETVNYREHFNATHRGKANGFGMALIKMLLGWEQYAATHHKRYEGPIGSDGVMGKYWAEAGLAMKRLLDGDTGGLDCGSIAHNITSAIEAQGFKTDGYNLVEDGE